MAGKRIPELDAISGANTANDDNLVIFDTSAGTTKRIIRSQLAAGIVGDLPYTPAVWLTSTTIPTAIAEIEAAAFYTVSVARSTWSELSTLTGSANQTAAVFSDGGTHTDPILGTIVANEGIYRYSTSPAGWERLANLEATDAATSATAAAASAATAELASINGTSTGDIAHIIINPDGVTGTIFWRGFKDGGTLSLTPDATPKVVLSVQDCGYDADGNQTTVTRAVVGTVAARQPYPNQTSPVDTEDLSGASRKIYFSEPIYAKSKPGFGNAGAFPLATCLNGIYVDNGSGGSSASSLARALYCINTSTRSYPLPIVNWACSAYQRGGSSGFSFEVYSDTQFCFSGRTAARVEVIVKDSANVTSTGSTTTMVASNQVGTTDPYPLVYRVAVPTTGLTDGAGTASIKVYPWLGDTVWHSTTSGMTWPTPRVADFPVLIDAAGNYTECYAALDTVSGNDATGVVSTTKTTAQASPFLTVAGARAALKTFNNARGHNDNAAGYILLKQDIAGFGESLAANWTTGLTWGGIDVWTTTTPQTVGITEAAVAANKRVAHLLDFRNVFIRSTVDAFVLDGVTDGNVSGLPQVYNRFYNCKFSASATTNALPLLYQIGLMDFIGCTFLNCATWDLRNYSVNRQHHRLHLGTTHTTTSTSTLLVVVWTAIGCVFHGTPIDFTDAAQPYTQKLDGLIHANNKFMSLRSATYYCANNTYTKGIAVVQNVYELIVATVPSLSISADSVTTPTANLVMRHNTVVGGRTNAMYNDTGSSAIAKTGASQYNLFYQWNIKRDPFSPGNANRIGNWEVSHGVGCFGNHFTNNATGADTGGSASVPGPNSWLGEYIGVGSTTGTAITYTTDNSYNGAGTGDGNYLPTGTVTTIQNKVTAGRAAYPYDIRGTARKNTGTGSCGAYEVG